MDFNGFENYIMRILRPPNIETGELDLNMIDDKYQYKNDLIVNNALGDTKLRQILGKIKVSCPYIG